MRLWTPRRRAAMVAAAVALATSAGTGAFVSSPAAAQTSARSGSTKVHFFLAYGGSERGQALSFLKFTSFTPPQVDRTIQWNYTWVFACFGSSTLAPNEAGQSIGCNAVHTEVGGGSNLIDNYAPSSNCFATFHLAKGAVVSINGYFPKTTTDTLVTNGGPPPNGAVLQSSPTCGYPPGNIVWSGPDALHVTFKGLLKQPWQATQRSVTGTVSGSVSQVNLRQLMFAGVRADSPLDQISGTLNEGFLGRQIEDWAAERIDLLHQQRETRYWGGQQIPVLAPVGISPVPGQLSVTITDVDPMLLFTAHQRLAAFTPTPLQLTPAPGALTHLADQSTPPRIRIDIAFKPDSGPKISSSTTYVPTLHPVINSIGFGGSTADPTIVVHGQDLGGVPAAQPSGSISGQAGCPTISGSAGSDYGPSLSLTNLSGNWGAGRNVNGLETDCIGIVPTSVTPTAATFKLGSLYTQNPTQFSLKDGDEIQVVLNGAWFDAHVKYGTIATS